MALITKNDNVSIGDTNTLRIAGLFAGEALGKLDACRIGDDGKVYKASTSYKTGTVSNYAGFTNSAVAQNAPVTLFRALSYGSYGVNMTPGTYLFISASTDAGKLSDAVVLAGDSPVAVAMNSTDIMIIK